MMGSPFYYDVLYDCGPGDVVFHDCMWSGICTCCIQLVHQDAHYQRPPDDQPADVHVTVKSNNTIGHTDDNNNNLNSITTTTTTTTTTLLTQEATPSEKLCQKEQTVALIAGDTRKVRHKDVERVVATTSGDSRKPHQRIHEQTCKTIPGDSKKLRHKELERVVATTSADNKKLRHREVEKNRHRQLQAMVKTLSDRIPGGVDKETQVQTMKRAARYCVYLRDVLTAISHGQTMLTKDKLEKIYHRSCDNVNLIMSQQ